jgi:hypothetical protein
MRCCGWVAVALLLGVSACKSATSDAPSKTAPAKKARSDAGAAGKGSSTDGEGKSTPNSGPDGAAGSMANGDAGGSKDAGTTRRDAGSTSMMDAGTTHMPDSAVVTHGDAGMGTPDAALLRDAQIGMEGSCCAEHDTPGCSNADLVVCVCEKLSSCCTTAWDHACVLIVKQKYCQAGIRDCVCGDGQGQWMQHSCCDSDWSATFCDQVAQTQCGAAPGCL